MAEELKIKVTGDSLNAVNSLNSVDNSLMKTVKQVASLAAAFVGIKKTADFFKSAVAAAADQEEIFQKLSFAVESTGVSFTSVKDDLDEYFASLQKVTKYGDTDSAKTLQELIFYTGDLGSAMNGMRLSMDLASSGMFDLSTATRMVGMATQGNIEMLGRYFAELKVSNNEILKTMTNTEKAAYAFEVLQSKVSGLSFENVDTLNAKMQQIANYWGDIKETLGDIVISESMGGLDQTLTKVQQIDTQLKESSSFLRSFVSGTITVFKTIGTGISTAFKGIVQEIIVVAGVFSALGATGTAVANGISNAFIFTGKIIGAVFSGIYTQAKTNFEAIGKAADAIVTRDFQGLKNALGEIGIFDEVQKNLDELAPEGVFADYEAIMKGAASETTTAFNNAFEDVKQASKNLWGEFEVDSQQATDNAYNNIREIESRLAGTKIKIDAEIEYSLDDDLDISQSPVEQKIKIVADFESTISELDRFAAVGIDVTDRVKEAFSNLYAELEALGMQDSETYQYFVAMKKQADDAYFEQKRALIEEDAALLLNYYDIAGNAAAEFTEGLIMKDLNWKNLREGVYRSLLKSTMKYFADMGKQYIIDLITRKSIAKAAAAASIATSVVTGKSIAAAYATPAALANTATFGAASIAGSAGLTATVGLAKGLAAAADGAYIDSSGKIHGAGTGTSDSILAMTEQGQPIMISNGEMIIKEKAVKEYYHDLQAINHDQKPSFSNVTNNKIQKFVNGGAISKVSNVASTVNNAKNLTTLIDNNFDSFTDNISNSKENFTENIKNSFSDINSNKLVKIQEESQNSIFNNIQMTPANNSPSDTIINMVGAATGAYVDDSGKIHGAGTGVSDSIMAITEQGETILVSNGEMIVKEKAVKEYYHDLQAINHDRKPSFSNATNNNLKKFSSGGAITNNVKKLAVGGTVGDTSTFNTFSTFSQPSETNTFSNFNVKTSNNVTDFSSVVAKLDELIKVQKETKNATLQKRPINITNNAPDVRVKIDNEEYERNILRGAGYDY